MNPLARLDPAVSEGSAKFAATAVPALEAARSHLLRLANPNGYWLGDVETDVGPVADYILMQEFLQRPHPEKVGKAANYILEKQLPEGGWCLYEGGKPDIDLIVKAYFALKLAGRPAEAPEMRRARQVALELGGAQAAGVYTRFYLALFRQFEWSGVPAIPPEVLFLPRFCYVSMYDVSAWTRAMLVPLSIIWAHRPRRPVVDEARIDELFAGGPNGQRNSALPRDSKWLTTRNMFLFLDGLLRRFDRLPLKPLRSRALRQAEKWMLERLDKSGAFGRAHPALMYSILALDCLGYAHDHPILQRALKEFQALEVEDARTLRFQPFQTPVSDTAAACRALAEAGAPADGPLIARTTQWLLDRQALRPGDWHVKNHKVQPGGWYAEFDNEIYPSVDTTATVLLALNRVRNAGAGPAPDAGVSPEFGGAGAERLEVAMAQGLSWLRGMQGSDGGFAAFDRDNNHTLLRYSPLAGPNAMLDDSCSDITGRALEALAALGRRKGSEAADRAIAYLRQHQGADGCWLGRWGVNGIFGTSCALRGLAAAGEDMREGYVVLAVEWLRAVQNVDGGWGESCASYDDPDQRGIGPSTPSQTAWALMGFFAFADFQSTSVRRGIEYLLAKQTAEGAWEESQYTGTRFPRVSYTRNSLHRQYYPLLCLAEFARGAGLMPAPIGRSTAAG